jgi:hypothetical protein
MNHPNVQRQWSHHTDDEATWELEEELKSNYPNLFSNIS